MVNKYDFISCLEQYSWDIWVTITFRNIVPSFRAKKKLKCYDDQKWWDNLQTEYFKLVHDYLLRFLIYQYIFK